MAGALAAASLVALAVLASADEARAQCQAATDTEKVRRSLDLNQRIQDLETIRNKIEKEHHVVMIYPGGAGMVTAEQAGELFGAAVFEGRLHPDSIPRQIAIIRLATNVYLRDHILPDIESARECWAELNGTAPATPTPVPTPPSAAASQIDWPAPMDWIRVKGQVRGSYVAECAGNSNLGYPAVKSAGTYRLEFLGDGRVRGIFGDDARQYSGLGEIKPDGTATGDARTTDPEVFFLRWTARFERLGVDIQMPSHTLDVMSASRGPYSILVDCKPGYMRQE
jgi:hypothetical protein